MLIKIADDNNQNQSILSYAAPAGMIGLGAAANYKAEVAKNKYSDLARKAKSLLDREKNHLFESHFKEEFKKYEDRLQELKEKLSALDKEDIEPRRKEFLRKQILSDIEREEDRRIFERNILDKYNREKEILARAKKRAQKILDKIPDKKVIIGTSIGGRALSGIGALYGLHQLDKNQDQDSYKAPLGAMAVGGGLYGLGHLYEKKKYKEYEDIMTDPDSRRISSPYKDKLNSLDMDISRKKQDVEFYTNKVNRFKNKKGAEYEYLAETNDAEKKLKEYQGELDTQLKELESLKKEREELGKQHMEYYAQNADKIKTGRKLKDLKRGEILGTSIKNLGVSLGTAGALYGAYKLISGRSNKDNK